MKLDSLHALYIEQLQDIHSAERQVLEVLPRLATVAHHRELKQCFNDHLVHTRTQLQRLDAIFERVATISGLKMCRGMAGLIQEATDFIEFAQSDPDVSDAGLIAAAQRVKHYEIAAYGTVCTYAEEMGLLEDLQLLRESLAEEKQTDQQLSVLAERHINVKANT